MKAICPECSLDWPAKDEKEALAILDEHAKEIHPPYTGEFSMGYIIRDPELPAGFRAPSVPSSNIKAIAWLSDTNEDLLAEDLEGRLLLLAQTDSGKLAVLFTNGTRYEYPFVPKATVTALLEADSIGKAFNELVKNAKNDKTGEALYTAIKVDPESLTKKENQKS